MPASLPFRYDRGKVWGYVGGIPKVSIYLPDELYARAKARDLPLSALAQGAIEAALSRDANATWIERMRSRPRGITTVLDTRAAMDEVKDEWGR